MTEQMDRVDLRRGLCDEVRESSRAPAHRCSGQILDHVRHELVTGRGEPCAQLSLHVREVVVRTELPEPEHSGREIDVLAHRAWAAPSVLAALGHGWSPAGARDRGGRSGPRSGGSARSVPVPCALRRRSSDRAQKIAPKAQRPNADTFQTRSEGPAGSPNTRPRSRRVI
jgi:hypothetical protein